MTNEFPEFVHDIARDANQSHPDSASEAAEYAYKKLKKIPEFKKLTDNFMILAIQSLIHDQRHLQNVQIKRSASQYGTKAKVSVGSSAAVRRVAEKSMFDLRIGGSRLGGILGEDLNRIADEEAQAATGHMRNAQFLRLVSKFVPEGKTVEQATTNNKLNAVWVQSCDVVNGTEEVA